MDQAVLLVAVRSSLRPLADDFDDDILEYIANEVREVLVKKAHSSSLLDLICDVASLVVPGFLEQPLPQRHAAAQRLQKAVQGGSNGDAFDTGVKGAGGGGARQNSKQQENLSPSIDDDILEYSRSPTASNTLEAMLTSISSEAVIELRAILPTISPEAARYALGKASKKTGSTAKKGSIGTSSSSSSSSTKSTALVAAATEYALEHDVETELAEAREAEKAQQQDRLTRQRLGIATTTTTTTTPTSSSSSSTSTTAVALAAAEARARAAVLARFDEAPDEQGIRHRPSLPKEMSAGPKKGEKVLKYLEGKPIYMRSGEKFYQEPEEQHGTAHTLKIKKKGQGGKSPGFL